LKTRAAAASSWRESWAHEAVGLRHLGAEADDRDGEGDAALGPPPVEDGEQALAAGDEGGDGFGDADPDRHSR